MHYRDLFKAAELFMRDPNSYDHAYKRARKNVDWRNLDQLSRGEITNNVIKFLNEWNCRLDSAYFNQISHGIKEAFNQASPFLNAIENETLEDIDFRNVKKVGDKEFDHFEIIHSIFAEFCNIGYRFRWVATSKTLHQILPKLFVMWDNPICNKLGLELSARSYVHDFLPLMKQEVNEAVTTYMQDHICKRNVAIYSIIKRCCEISGYEKTLAKLVDEYNWIKYTKGYL